MSMNKSRGIGRRKECPHAERICACSNSSVACLINLRTWAGAIYADLHKQKWQDMLYTHLEVTTAVPIGGLCKKLIVYIPSNCLVFQELGQYVFPFRQACAKLSVSTKAMRIMQTMQYIHAQRLSVVTACVIPGNQGKHLKNPYGAHFFICTRPLQHWKHHKTLGRHMHHLHMHHLPRIRMRKMVKKSVEHLARRWGRTWACALKLPCLLPKAYSSRQ